MSLSMHAHKCYITVVFQMALMWSCESSPDKKTENIYPQLFFPRYVILKHGAESECFSNIKLHFVNKLIFSPDFCREFFNEIQILEL